MNPSSNDDDLLAGLSALPARRTPPEAVWRGIAAALDEAPAAAGQVATPTLATVVRLPQRPRRWRLPISLAAAASLAALAVLLLPPRATAPGPVAPQVVAPLLAQAEAMSGEYRQAIAALPPAPASADLQPALHALDDSAAQIRTALRERPDAGYLLGQLRRTYDKRLELTRMAARSTPAGTT